MLHVIVGKHHSSEFFCIPRDLTTPAADEESFFLCVAVYALCKYYGSNKKNKVLSYKIDKRCVGVFLKWTDGSLGVVPCHFLSSSSLSKYVLAVRSLCTEMILFIRCGCNQIQKIKGLICKCDYSDANLFAPLPMHQA